MGEKHLSSGFRLIMDEIQIPVAPDEPRSEPGESGDLFGLDDAVKALEDIVLAEPRRDSEWTASAEGLVDLYHTKLTLTRELRYEQSCTMPEAFDIQTTEFLGEASCVIHHSPPLETRL
ncbi:unnamed protein product [Clonostachys rosea]|uniref:Uncharacterized protein n=1 Tax=Bionectria ochroleuca TaxID=29856 RepID=A0ABY6UDS1_BIOOC|nr:unnamed protein product [Clonostachys rosea]